MKSSAAKLQNAINRCLADFTTILEDEWNQKPQAERWSKKEILGHLADSAFNNLQRFVRGAYEENFKIVYAQDQWVRVQQYQEMPLKEVQELWVVLNKQIVHILLNYPEDRRGIRSDIALSGTELITMEEIAVSYLEHMQHHLDQILTTSNP
jgi:uncharacterized damage-inducible protein DinB